MPNFNMKDFNDTDYTSFYFPRILLTKLNISLFLNWYCQYDINCLSFDGLVNPISDITTLKMLADELRHGDYELC